MEFNKEETATIKDALLNLAISAIQKATNDIKAWDKKDYANEALKALQLRKRFEDETK